MVLKLTKKPEKSRTGMAVTGPTKVATWGAQPPERGSPNLLTGPPPATSPSTPGTSEPPPDLQRGGGGSDEKPEGLSHQGRGGGQGGEEEEARGFGGLPRHPVHDAAVGDGADHLRRGQSPAGPFSGDAGGVWGRGLGLTWKGTSAMVLAR